MSSSIGALTQCSSCHFSSLNNLEYLLHQAENHMAVIKYHCKLCPESTYLKEAMTLHMMTKHLNLEIKDAENQDPPRASVQEEEEKEKDHDVEDDNEGRLVIDEKGLVVRKRNSKCLRGGKGLRAGDYLDTVPTGTAIKKKRKRGPSGAAVKKTRSLAPPPPLTPTKLVPTSVPPGIFSPNRIAFDPLPVIAQLKEPLEEYNHNKNTPDIDGNNNDNNNHGQPREPAKPSCGKCGQTFSDMNKATQDHVRNCFASALGSESTAGPNVADNNSNNAAASAVDSSVNPKAAKDEKKVSCPECNLRFKSKTGMFLHVDSVHRGIRYDCDICGTSYTQRPALNRHMKKIHSLSYATTPASAKAVAAPATSNVSSTEAADTSTPSEETPVDTQESPDTNDEDKDDDENEASDMSEEMEESQEDYENDKDASDDDGQGGVEVGRVVE